MNERRGHLTKEGNKYRMNNGKTEGRKGKLNEGEEQTTKKGYTERRKGRLYEGERIVRRNI